MGKRKRCKVMEINDAQMNILLNFAEKCKSLCFGRKPPGLAVKVSPEWRELAREMNHAYPEEKLWKSAFQWKQYWAELKNKTRSKAALAKRQSRYKKKVPVILNLKEYEQRILDLAEIASKDRLKKQSSVESTDTESFSPEPPNLQSTPNTTNSPSTFQMNSSFRATEQVQSPSVVSSNQNPRNHKLPIAQVVITPISEGRPARASRLSEAVAALAQAQAELAHGTRAVADALFRLADRANAPH